MEVNVLDQPVNVHDLKRKKYYNNLICDGSTKKSSTVFSNLYKHRNDRSSLEKETEINELQNIDIRVLYGASTLLGGRRRVLKEDVGPSPTTHSH